MKIRSGKQIKQSRFYLREWQRTVLLVLLLAFAIGFIYWTRTQYADNFTDTFQG